MHRQPNLGWLVLRTRSVSLLLLLLLLLLSLLLLDNDQAVQQCKDDPTIVAACMLQSFYEAAMVNAQSHFVADHFLCLLKSRMREKHLTCVYLLQYTFVFMWTPAMEARTVVPPAKIPFGLIFASFMVTQKPATSRQPKGMAYIPGAVRTLIRHYGGLH